MVELEHINVTVSDPHQTAAWMQDVFGWKIRWEGPRENERTGYTVHIGSDKSYLALYSENTLAKSGTGWETISGLNHIALVVDDLDEIEAKVRKHFEPHFFADYDPGKRFYFFDADQIEYEVVCYA